MVVKYVRLKTPFKDMYIETVTKKKDLGQIMGQLYLKNPQF